VEWRTEGVGRVFSLGIQVTGKKPLLAAEAFLFVGGFALHHLGENDDQGVEGERLDQGQAENQR
jgi:hypothetical protein